MKPWYLSKLVGLGIVQTLIGTMELVAKYLETGDYSPQAVVIMVSGILTVVLRVWFTDKALG